MATLIDPNGVSVVQVDANGSTIGTTNGVGKSWNRQALSDAGSKEWLSEVVVTDDAATLQSIIQRVSSGAITFQGNGGDGTSGTSLDTAVYLHAPADLTPAAADYKYYVLARGNWVDKTTGNPSAQGQPNAQLVANELVVSETDISTIPSLMDEWNSVRD